MASLMELVDQVNRGESVEKAHLELYQDSPNSAEKFLAHHAHAMVDLRSAHQHLLQSLEAIDYSDQKVLNQFISISNFLNLTDLRAGPVVRFGASAIGRREYALGLEAIANGMSYDLAHGGAFSRDRDNCLMVSAQIERAAQGIGFTAAGEAQPAGKQLRLGYVISQVADEEAAARTLRGLARHLDQKKFKLHVYITEVGVRRDKQQFAPSTPLAASGKRGSQTLEFLTKEKVGVTTAPMDGDLASAARALGEQMIKDRIDVALFDANQSDPVAALLSGWELGCERVHLCRRSPLYAACDAVIYLDSARYEADRDFWQRKGVESRYVLEGIDLDEPTTAAPQRSVYGIPEQAVVLATAGSDLDRTLGGEFVDAVINILRAHPHAVYLLAGEAELAWQKRKFESAGVGKRVGYAGKRRDLPGFLRIADIYLTEFPAGGAAGVMQAMAMERAVVAMHWGDGAEQSQAAALAGSEAAIVGRDANLYVERVSKLVRESLWRQKLGKSLRQRVEQHFSFAQMARQIEQLCEQLIHPESLEKTETVALGKVA